MEYVDQIKILDEILNYKLDIIPNETRFWMIRTKKGYFYNEFVGKKFVALAWNLISESTDFSTAGRENLKDSIVMRYPEIRRPSTVINKCISFVQEIKKNDILVIPNEGSKLITFAYAGDYFEDESKTVDLEKMVIDRIEKRDVVINEISCPYKKRRHITPIRTVKSEEINYSLYRAISNYHGISNLDSYSRYILNMMFNIYSFNNDVNIVFNVRKENLISPRHLSGILYETTNFLCDIGIAEDKISTQININSPGPIDFCIADIYNLLKANHVQILALLVIVGGGNFLTFKLPGVPGVIKDILTLKNEIKKSDLEVQKAEVEVMQKKVELYEKIKATGIDPTTLSGTLESVARNATALEVQPIETLTMDVTNLLPVSEENEQEDE